jgi:FADH2 O2-dependent halogenase
MAMILRQLGLTVAVFDRNRHPRFAIGESSTPAADFLLESIADRFDLARLRPLARYGSWKKTYPEISCGLKRGFSYFHHRPDQLFETDDQHSTELIVSSSVSDEVGDTHWYRAEVDTFLCREADRLGAVVEEGVDVRVEAGAHRWRLCFTTDDRGERAVEARFLIDATGPAGVLPRLLKLADECGSLRTRSRALFKHVIDLPYWDDCLREGGFSTAGHPFRSDDAALHYLIDSGWMWVLRFDNGITSVGFSIDCDRYRDTGKQPPQRQFEDLLSHYPSIGRHLRPSRVSPTFISKDVVGTGRLQRLWTPAAGEGWCLLPNSAGFIDPFYSTGIAQTLSGIARLGAVFREFSRPASFQERLADYGRAVEAEVRMADKIVATAFASMGCDPELFHLASTLYFTAATTFERRYREGMELPQFLLAGDSAFENAVGRVSELIEEARAFERARIVSELTPRVADLIRPFNKVGLLDPSARHMYRCTAAK